MVYNIGHWSHWIDDTKRFGQHLLAAFFIRLLFVFLLVQSSLLIAETIDHFLKNGQIPASFLFISNKRVFNWRKVSISEVTQLAAPTACIKYKTDLGYFQCIRFYNTLLCRNGQMAPNHISQGDEELDQPFRMLPCFYAASIVLFKKRNGPYRPLFSLVSSISH